MRIIILIACILIGAQQIAFFNNAATVEQKFVHGIAIALCAIVSFGSVK